jgi:hypothetical protein
LIISKLKELALSGRFSVRVAVPAWSDVRSVVIFPQLSKETVTHFAKVTVSFLKNLFVRKIIHLIVVAGVHFIFHAVAIKINPKEQDMTLGSFYIAGGKNGSGFLQTSFVAIV